MCNNKVNIVNLHADINNVAVGCFMSAGLSDPNNPQSMWLLSGEPEGSQMLFYVWFEFTSWLRGVGQGKGAWDCFLTIWAWDSCAFCNGKIKELDYWEIQPLLGLLDHGKVPVIN